MPTAWLSLKKSLSCRSGAEDVHDPLARKSPRASKNDIHIHRSITRSALIPSSCSPQSMASGEFLDPVSLQELGIKCRSRNSESNPGSAPPDRCAVTELRKGDFSRNIVEIIFRTGWPKPCEISHNKNSNNINDDNNNNNNHNNNNSIIINNNGDPCERIQRVLKVHNTQAEVARFEEYREMVRARAGGLCKRDPRCMADGNELLRFHCTALKCSLGRGGDSNPCTVAGCNVCRIIRTGLCDYEGREGENSGFHTTATSGRAHECSIANTLAAQRAMIVCRVIAGRVLHNPMDKFDAKAKFSGFDSVAGESVGRHCNAEELFVFNSRAVLPCFVVVYRSD